MSSSVFDQDDQEKVNEASYILVDLIIPNLSSIICDYYMPAGIEDGKSRSEDALFELGFERIVDFEEKWSFVYSKEVYIDLFKKPISLEIRGREAVLVDNVYVGQLSFESTDRVKNRIGEVIGLYVAAAFLEKA